MMVVSLNYEPGPRRPDLEDDMLLDMDDQAGRSAHGTPLLDVDSGVRRRLPKSDNHCLS